MSKRLVLFSMGVLWAAVCGFRIAAVSAETIEEYQEGDSLELADEALAPPPEYLDYDPAIADETVIEEPFVEELPVEDVIVEEIDVLGEAVANESPTESVPEIKVSIQ